jgi:hypothetical protein
LTADPTPIVQVSRRFTVSLTHEGVLPEYLERTKDGWTMLLGKLAKLVEGKV